jgi:lambda family phage portal protein
MSGCRIGRSYLSPHAQQIALPKMQGSSFHRTAGGASGTLSNWSPRRLTWIEEGRQRERIVERANDIAANNAHGASLIDSITINTVGTGLWPQSKPNWKRLGITEAQAQEIAETMEWEFDQWSREADASAPSAETATCNFYGLQFQNIWSMLVNGEFINLPLMLDDPSRRYSLALQTVDPVRLRTPMALLGAKDVRDGIRLGKNGQPTGYLMADPEDGKLYTSLDLRNFREIRPRAGHRPTVIHRFHKKTPEQVRGNSILAPAMKFFRDINDYLDFELVGSIIAASFPVFIEKSPNTDPESEYTEDPTGADQTRYQEVSPGVMYGNAGEKPNILANPRPAGSFGIFVETILRAVGAAAGMPYEIIAKDFSKTNYSSARAALEEAWRVFGMYQDWLVNYFCQVIWEMVWEEAWLRGRIKLPAGSPDFYSAKAEWTAATWIVPERTNLDPVKEIVAAVMAKNNNMGTDADFAAKRGKDWEAVYEQRAREIKKAKELELPEGPGAKKETVSRLAPQPEDQTETNDSQDNPVDQNKPDNNQDAGDLPNTKPVEDQP